MGELNTEQIHESINYVENVLENWTQWQTHHTRLTQAMSNALVIIKSQEQRIGELETRLRYLLQSKTIQSYDEVDIHTKEYVKDIHSLDANIEHYIEWNKELAEENERLKAQKYMAYSDGRIEMIPTVESVRADTVRKMQKMLKNYYHHLSGKTLPATVEYHIEQIAEEMLNSQED